MIQSLITECFGKNAHQILTGQKLAFLNNFLEAHNSGVWCYYVMRMEDIVVSWPSLSYVYAVNIKSSLANIRRQSPNIGILDPFLNHHISEGSGSFDVFGGFSWSIPKGQFSTPKVRNSCYFCLIFRFAMISMKISETYGSDWYNWEWLLEFFSEFLVLPFSRNEVFCWKNVILTLFKLSLIHISEPTRPY